MSARTTIASTNARIDAIESKLDAILASLAPATSAPAKAKSRTTASPFVKAPKGHKMSATRAANLAQAVPGKHCPACQVGFAFAKTECPRCGDAL